MSRLLVSNQLEWFRLLKEANKKSGLIEQKEETLENLACVVYRKLMVDSCNYYYKDGNYIMVTGTFFYGKLFGKEALVAILKDFSLKDIIDIRKELTGTYAILIKYENIIKIFIDETQTYSIYYYHENNDYIVTNLYLQIAYIIQADINENAFLERLIRSTTLDESSPYKNIFKLMANQYIYIDTEKGNFEIRNVELNSYYYAFQSREEAVNEIYSYLKNLVTIREMYLTKLTHFYTGGIDSRLELAMSLSGKNHIKLGYWNGQDIISNGTQGDIDVVSKTSKMFEIPMELYDVTEPYSSCLKAITREKCLKYGEYASIYASNPKWFEILETNTSSNCVIYGFFGEIFRPLSELDLSYNNRYTIKDFIVSVYCRTGLEKEILDLPGFYDYLEDEFKRFIGHDGTITIEEAFNLFTNSRYGADCIRNNYANIFMYSFPILSQKKIKDMNASIPYKWRNGDYISLQLTKLFFPELQSIPYFTHHHYVKYNKDKSIVEEKRTNRLKLYVKKNIKDTVFERIYHRYIQRRIHPKTSDNQQIFEESIKIMKNSNTIGGSKIKIKTNPKWEHVEIGTLATATAEILCAEKIKNE